MDNETLAHYIQKAYRDSPSAFFRECVEAIGLGVMVVDAYRHIRYANRAAHEIFDYAPATLVGTFLNELLPEELRKKHEQHLSSFFDNPHARVMNGGQIVAGATRLGRRVSLRIALDFFEFDDERNYVAVITPVEKP